MIGSFMSLLFFLFISIASLFSFLSLITKFNETQKNCIKNIESIQILHRSSLRKLLNLNFYATSLRQELKLAKNALKVAADPYSKSAALAWLSKVRVSQTSLNAQQKSIIYKAELDSLRFRKRFFGKIHIKPFSILIRAQPFKSLSPSYYLKENFEKNKRIRLTTSFKVKFPKVFHMDSLSRFKYICQNTLLKRSGKPSELRLLKGKYSSKVFSF